MAVTAITSTHAVNSYASSAIPSLQLSVRVSTPAVIFGKVHLGNPGPPVEFETKITPNVPLAGKFDIYFGITGPNGSAYSWIKRNNGEAAGLTEGLKPISTKVTFPSPGSAVDHMNGQKIEHQFMPTDSPGMYFLFSFVVPENADPSDTENWIAQDSMFFAIVP